MRILIALAALAVARPALAAQPVTTAPIVAAERAFAVDGLTLGIKGSFLKHSAADALVFQPDPVNAHAAFGAQPDGPPGPKLEWWPLWAGISRDGNFGFTTGPYAVDGARKGHYFTVWKRQADGGWKWIFDGGAGADAKTEPGSDGTVVSLPVSTVDAASPEVAKTEVAEVETQFAVEAAKDQKAAYLAHLAADGRVYVAPLPPAKGAADFATTLSSWPTAFTFLPLGAEAAGSGDMVWTYGDARWARDGQDRRGHYARIWQKRAEGWKLVFAEIVPAPPAKP
jgi:ketosteroid isomerase-like protein